MATACIHCRGNPAANNGRGLCGPCNADPAIRNQRKAYGCSQADDDMTMAQLDELEAEMRPTMPGSYTEDGEPAEPLTPRYREPRFLFKTRQARVMRKKI
jgi:hypothetical protein